MGTGTVQVQVMDEEENLQTITLNNVAVPNGMMLYHWWSPWCYLGLTFIIDLTCLVIVKRGGDKSVVTCNKNIK